MLFELIDCVVRFEYSGSDMEKHGCKTRSYLINSLPENREGNCLKNELT